MQAQKQKGELLGEMHGKTVTTTIKEITPMGVKLEINDQAQFAGKYNANSMETVSVFQKKDGTNEWETKGIQMTNEGDFIVVNGRGTGKNTGPTTASWEGEVVFMTQSSKLAWLNTTKGWIEGSGDNAKGEFNGKLYALK